MLTLIRQHDFDVLIVDLNLGDGTGFELIEHMRAVRPTAEAVVISAMEDEQYALIAFELGTTGYLVNNCWFGSFPQEVLEVANGGASITPNLSRKLFNKFDPRPTTSLQHNEVKEQLSARVRKVIKLVPAGSTSTEIDTRLGISGHTVNTHIKNMYRKLNVRTRAQTASLAVKKRLL